MKKKNRKIIKVMMVVFILVFLISSFFIIQKCLEERKSRNDNENLIEEVISDDEGFSIDWDKLKIINGDIVGWIVIENTNINYPILKADNDLYYLTHSFNRERNSNGAIFLTSENANLFHDEEITIYGHHIRDGIMFGTLKNYMNRDFFESHSIIYIYTPDANYEGEIFSVFSRNIFKVENEIKELDFVERIDYYKSMSIYQDLEMKSINKIVRLMTCSYLNSKTRPTEERYYIVASLKKVN